MHQEGPMLSAQQQDCVSACHACADICDRCADDMIGMDPDRHKDLMRACIRLCRDCADICTLSARWMSRLSPLSEWLGRLCADVCDRCAETCERHAPHHALCAECAVMCREMAGATA